FNRYGFFRCSTSFYNRPIESFRKLHETTIYCGLIKEKHPYTGYERFLIYSFPDDFVIMAWGNPQMELAFRILQEQIEADYGEYISNKG
ncbi:MAG: hypothetical protein LUF81_05520, partial [Clostridiales bacterium]|nr:hypothetical protein [Clostridiales bacterium]